MYIYCFTFVKYLKNKNWICKIVEDKYGLKLIVNDFEWMVFLSNKSNLKKGIENTRIGGSS